MDKETLLFGLIGFVTAIMGYPVYDFTERKFYFKNLIILIIIVIIVNFIIELCQK